VRIDGARGIGFGVPVRVEDHRKELPGACCVLVSGRRWASLGWVENGAERLGTFRLLLERWRYWDVYDRDGSVGNWGRFWRFAFAAPFSDFANFGNDRVFIRRFRGREGEGAPENVVIVEESVGV
jgi:hypothetical protein